MTIVYKAKDGSEFKDETTCKKYESITSKCIEYTEKNKVTLIPPSEFEKVFVIGYPDMEVWVQTLKDGDVTYDRYETYSLDETGHLNCTDYSCGLLEWSDEDKCYYRTIHAHSWKVEVLGVKNVIYW